MYNWIIYVRLNIVIAIVIIIAISKLISIVIVLSSTNYYYELLIVGFIYLWIFVAVMYSIIYIYCDIRYFQNIMIYTAKSIMFFSLLILW